MAEFGEFETKSESKIPVQVEMLEYEYIAKCNDAETLRAIVEVLQSGKEGHYPDVCLLSVSSHLTQCSTIFVVTSKS
jgi:hypothetical protein